MKKRSLLLIPFILLFVGCTWMDKEVKYETDERNIFSLKLDKEISLKLIEGNGKKDGQSVIIQDNVLRISAEDGDNYEQELADSQFLSQVELNYYEWLPIEEEAIILISLKCTEVEERGMFESIFLLGYKDGEFTRLLDGIGDDIFQSESYQLNYIDNRTIQVSLPGGVLDVTLKNILTFDNDELDSDHEKDLISRMEHQSSIGYPNIANGINNLAVDQSENELRITFTKIVYGFFHADLMGEIKYEYEYKVDRDELSERITFIADEQYEVVE